MLVEIQKSAGQAFQSIPYGHWGVRDLIYTPETSSGGPYSWNDSGVWLVYSDSNWRAAHAYIGETSQRVVDV